MKRPLIFRGVALALCALGLLLTLRAIRLTPSGEDQIRRKLADLEQVRWLQAEQARREAAVAFFDRLPVKSPIPMRELVGRVIGGAPPALHAKEARRAVAGWVVRSVELTFDQIALPDISRLVLAARGEGDRPPWRLVDCQITASEQGPDYGRATLEFEALEKSLPGLREPAGAPSQSAP